MTDAQPMTPAELAAIRERAERATPGPWHAHHMDDSVYMNTYFVTTSPYEPENELDVESPPGHIATTLLQSPVRLGGKGVDWDADSCFIAHARADIPALLAEVDRLREKLSAIDGVLQKCDRGSRESWPGSLLVIADIVEGGE